MGIIQRLVKGKSEAVDWSDFFKATEVVDTGAALKPKAKRVMRWDIVDGRDATEIEDVRPGCGCTASVIWVGDRVEATYTNTERTSGGKRESWIEKSLTVYFADGKARVRSPRGGMMWPGDKARQVIKFRVKVLV